MILLLWLIIRSLTFTSASRGVFSEELIHIIFEKLYQQLPIMIKESQISNFLDLIKHIAEIKQQTNSFKKKKNKTRYQQHEEESIEHQPKQSSDHQQSDIGRQSVNAYQHRKLRGFFERKKNNRSFKIEQPHSHNSIQTEMTIYNSIGIVKERKNLYELYCEDIQKKREDRFKGTLFGKNSKQNNIKTSWEDDIVAELQKYQGTKSLHRERSMPPIGKSKQLKGIVQNTKVRRADIKLRHKRNSTKKVQPSELNIGTIGEFKMPKISHNTTLIGELKSSTGKIPQGKNSTLSKNAKINLNHDLTGWAQQEDQNKFFHPDLF